MPQITKDTLAAKLTELDDAEKQAFANLNAIAGARQLTLALQAELEKPDVAPAGTDRCKEE